MTNIENRSAIESTFLEMLGKRAERLGVGEIGGGTRKWSISTNGHVFAVFEPEAGWSSGWQPFTHVRMVEAVRLAIDDRANAVVKAPTLASLISEMNETGSEFDGGEVLERLGNLSRRPGDPEDQRISTNDIITLMRAAYADGHDKCLDEDSEQ